MPILPAPVAGPLAGRLPPARRPAGDDESIYTLRGYKAWAARVKAAWDAES